MIIGPYGYFHSDPLQFKEGQMKRVGHMYHRVEIPAICDRIWEKLSNRRFGQIGQN